MLTTDFIMESVTSAITGGIANTLILLMMINLIVVVVASAALIVDQNSDKRFITIIIISIVAMGMNMFDAYRTANTKLEINFSAQDDVKDFLEMNGYTKTTAKVINHYKSTNTDMPSTEIIYSYTTTDGTERFGTASVPNELKAGDGITNGEEIEVYYLTDDSTLSKCLYDTETIEYVTESISSDIVDAFATRAMIVIIVGTALQVLLFVAFELCSKLKHYYLHNTTKKSAC